MRRSWLIWTIFAGCAAVVLAAMGWVSWQAWRLDQAETLARQHAAVEEKVRLALWRMDSGLAPLIAQESARPYFVYNAFVTVDRAYGRMFNPRKGNEFLAPSPLLAEQSPHVIVYFQLGPDETLTSPQAPLGDNYDLAVPQYVAAEQIAAARGNLKQIGQWIDRAQLLARLPASPPPPTELTLSPLNRYTPEQRMAQRAMRNDLQQRDQQQLDFNLRNTTVQESANRVAQGQQVTVADEPLPPTDVRGVSMTPLWMDGRLVLARRVAVGGREYVQGCWLDWAGLRSSLIESIEDLLPAADLAPVAQPNPADAARMLAALPVRLVPGAVAAEAGDGVSPLWQWLTVAWACAVLAALAVAVLLAGVLRLSERRAAFVMAVTHELRTPLTTFQMYAEMLAEGMVGDESQRQSYLATLRAEAVRLTHMVENVLAYARLERGRTDGRRETLGLAELVARMQPRLAARAAQAGMELCVEADDAAAETPVAVNVSAVEQILFNLVDNACKYAAGVDDKRIHVALAGRDGTAELRVADHGPGIAAEVRRRLFRSFSKTAQEAAHSAPGIGLGLALSRRLARDLGGELRYEAASGGGACFILVLPIAG